MTRDEKLEAVFDAASTVFSQYGFRRTSMNDIAETAGISRPALYLLFENKEDLFLQLAAFRQNQAIAEAVAVLSEHAPVSDRIVRAILAYERIYYEPVASSPHGAELYDLSFSIASEGMTEGSNKLIKHLAHAIEDAVRRQEASFADSDINPTDFVELLMSSVAGMKKAAVSVDDFRQKVRNVATVFMKSVSPGADN